MGERRPSDRPLYWGGVNALRPPGFRPNVRQSAHTHWNTSVFFFLLEFVTFVCACDPNGQMTQNRKESSTRQRRQVGEGCM